MFRVKLQFYKILLVGDFVKKSQVTNEHPKDTGRQFVWSVKLKPYFVEKLSSFYHLLNLTLLKINSMFLFLFFPVNWKTNR